MSVFRFPLDNVLEIRKESERRSAVGLAKARGEADLARKAMSDLEAVREAGRARLAAAHGSGGAVGHLQNLATVVRQVEARIRDAEVHCQRADEQVVESLRDFHEALRSRKTIEELRERKLDEWRTEAVRGEQKAMDETALTRHGRVRLGAPDNEDRQEGSR